MSPTEYVWVLPRVLLAGRQRMEPVVFHPHVPGAARTDCGERVRRYGGYVYMVRLRAELDGVASPCSRCYRAQASEPVA